MSITINQLLFEHGKGKPAYWKTFYI